MSDKRFTVPNLIKAAAEGGRIFPDSVDLNPRFEQWGLPIRSQGGRGTCSVFAFVGLVEYAFAIRDGDGIILSVEFLNWAAHKVANRSVDGAFFSELWDGYLKYGICAETDMPYLPEFDPDLEPPAECLKIAERVRSVRLGLRWIKEWDVSTGLTDDQFAEIKLMLFLQFPVCGGFRWPKEAKWENGLLQMCPPSDVFDGHSIILAGYRDDPAQPGGGVFMIRNSGGESRNGYMSYEYVRTYMNDGAWIEPTN
jgi:hypothetical protein